MMTSGMHRRPFEGGHLVNSIFSLKNVNELSIKFSLNGIRSQQKLTHLDIKYAYVSTLLIITVVPTRVPILKRCLLLVPQ